MSDENPDLTLEASLEYLRHLDQFKMVVETIALDREKAVRDLGDCNTTQTTMRCAGKISGFTEVLDLLSRGDYSQPFKEASEANNPH